MKKIIVISLVILSTLGSAFLVFDSGKEPSANNEGLRKADIVQTTRPHTNK